MRTGIRSTRLLPQPDPTKITAKAAPADGDGVMIADTARTAARLSGCCGRMFKAALGKLFVPLARKINGKAPGEGCDADGR